MNPAVGGMPASDRKNSVIAPAKTGCRWPRPTHDPISRRSFPVGAPWYTSGVQEWNGTTAILNANPTARSAAAANIKRESVEGAPDNPAMREMFVVPVAPNARATPYKRIALENAPRRKYFSDAS